MATDPTAKIQRLFDDKSAWDEICDVPIFVAHEVTHKDGSKVTVDEGRLEKIRDNINLRWEEHGVPIVFTEGHRVPTFPYPEKDQPDILAYGKDAYIADRMGEPALWVKQYVPKGMLPTVRKYPFRSSEFRTEADEITGVALLKRDPKLDMGVVLYQQSTSSIYSYQDQAAGKICLYLENAMPDLMTPDKKDDLDTNPVAPAPGGDSLNPDDEKKFEMYMSKKYPKFGEMYASMCGDKVDQGGDDPTMNYQRDQVPPALAKQLADLKDRADKADAAAKRIKAQQVISKLRTVDGLYMDDPKGEEDMLYSLPEEAWGPHVKRIKINYQRDPAAGPMLPVGEGTRDANGDPEPKDAAEASQIVLYAEQNGINMQTDVGYARAKTEYFKSKRQRAAAY
jgi:hypothetical protein